MIELFQQIVHLSCSEEPQVMSNFDVCFRFCTRAQRDIEELPIFGVVPPIETFRNV